MITNRFLIVLAASLKIMRGHTSVLCALFFALAAVCGANASDLSAKYTWKPMKIGCGGYVRGVWAHPTVPDLIYCRVDVAAGYRWEPATRSWKNILTASSMPKSALDTDYYGVDSLVGAKTDPNCAYMSFNGKIYKSSNRGDSWAEATGNFNAPMDANGPGMGQRLQVDPANKDVVYYGSDRAGLWVTFDGGGSWSQVDEQAVPFGDAAKFKKLGVTTVRFDEKSGVDTIGRTKTIFVTVAGRGVFRTVDAGKTWNKISGGTDGPADTGSVRAAVVDKDGNYYMTDTSNQIVWRYNAQGKWESILKGKATAIDVDPFDSNRIFVVISAGGWVKRSTDFGKTWGSLDLLTAEESDTPWLVTANKPKIPRSAWISAGQLLFDSVEKGKLWFADGASIAATTDLASDKTISFTMVNNGIEALVSNQIIHPPGGAPVGTAWDFGGFRFANPDQNASAQIFKPGFFACWGVDWMGKNPKNMVAAMSTDYNPSQGANWGLLRSSDGGVTWTVGSSPRILPLNYGTVAVSAGNADHVVWIPDNWSSAEKAPSYFTRDGGATWQETKPNVSTGWSPHTQSVKPLASDKVLDDVFYAMCYEDNAFYKSTDGGATWVKASDKPGAQKNQTFPKDKPMPPPPSELRAVFGKAGHLWFVGTPHDRASTDVLWRSTDGGTTWTPCTNGGLTKVSAIGFGKEPAPGKYPTIFISGVVNGVRGIYRSTDEGQTWDKIGQDPLGIWGPLKCIDGDKDIFGKVYFTFSAGIGFGTGTTTETAGKPSS